MKGVSELVDKYIKKIDKSIFGRKSWDGWEKIGTILITILIIFRVLFLVFLLTDIYTIVTIDDDLVDETIERVRTKETEVIDMLLGKDYTVLRCSRKQTCCLLSVMLRILISILEILYFIYIGIGGNVLSGMLFYLIYILLYYALIFLIYYIGEIDENRSELMCPMPSEYIELLNE